MLEKGTRIVNLKWQWQKPGSGIGKWKLECSWKKCVELESIYLYDGMSNGLLNEGNKSGF